MTNPIPFNPETMTVSQVTQCAITLRTMFDLIDRDASDADIANYVKQTREYLLARWGAYLERIGS
jgi:hypothetical protein